MRGDVAALARISRLDDRADKAQSSIRRAIEKRELKKAKKLKKQAPAHRTCRRVSSLDCCLWTTAIRGSPGTDRVQSRLYRARHGKTRLCYVASVSDVAVVCAPREQTAKIPLAALLAHARGVEPDSYKDADQPTGAAGAISISAPMLVLKTDVDCGDVLYEASAEAKDVYVRAAKVDGTTLFVLCGGQGLQGFTGDAAPSAATPSQLGLDRELLRQLQNAAMHALGLVEP